MKKRFILVTSLILILIFELFSLTGCNNDEKKEVHESNTPKNYDSIKEYAYYLALCDEIRMTLLNK